MVQRAPFVGTATHGALLVTLGLLSQPLSACRPIVLEPDRETSTQDELWAFPGAEGFGADTVGGRGGSVLQVTNLDDSGPGSLRAAIDATGPRLIVFRVAGIIELQSSLVISNPFVTIAGQTAPPGGVTLKNGSGGNVSVTIRAHDVVVRYLRIRPGPGGGSDALGIYGPEAQRVVIDHCSLSWGVDDNVNTWYAAAEISIQWTLIAEALRNSTHPSGSHSWGVLLGSDGASNISLHHDLIAHNSTANPRIQTSGTVDVVNNVIYNPTTGTPGGWGPSHVSVEFAAPVAANYVGNTLRRSDSTADADYPYWISSSGSTTLQPALFLSGNVTPAAPVPTADGLNGVLRESDYADASSVPAPAPVVTTMDAPQAYDAVLATVGASARVDADGAFVADRDAVDERIVASVVARTGTLVDDPSQVGGWPAVLPQPPVPDADSDGMADVWEARHGFDANDGTDGAQDRDGDGYTNVEEYLNGTLP